MIKIHTFFNLKIILLLSLIFVLGCTNKSETEKYKIGFSQCLGDNLWRDAMNHSMQIQASLLQDSLKLEIFEAHRDTERQIAQIEKMIQEKFDLIIISPQEPTSIVPVIEKAFDSGIPIILIDRKINSNKFTTFVGADNLEVGRNAANYIASKDGKIKNVVEIKGVDNSTPVIERSKGFHQTIEKEPTINLIESIVGPDNTKFKALIDSIDMKPIHYVFAFNDELAYQVWDVANEMGVANKIKFIGVDGLNGSNGGIQMVKDKVLEATILYPTAGSEAIKLAMTILKGKNVSKYNILSSTVIDSRNADIMQNQFDKIIEHQEDIESQQSKIKEQQETYTSQSRTLRLVLGLLIISVILGSIIIYSWNIIRQKKRELEIINKKIIIQRDQIKTSNEAKVNFFTGLSHEFKTPITLILSSIESLIEENRKRDYKLISELGLIFSNSKRLLRLINQLLDFRKIEDRKFILRASETNIFDFTKSIYKDFEREAIKRGIDFSITTNNENLLIYIDRNLMDKVFFNMLSNAFKFTPNQGEISINILDELDTNFVKIHFKDSGIGIPEEELKSIFKPFFQGSNNNKPSSGIGLHISKEFIDMHNGKVEVKSNNGAEIIITLYKSNVHLNNDQIILESNNTYKEDFYFDSDYEDDLFSVNTSSEDNEKLSILIIEDNSDLVKFLKNKLSQVYEIHVSDGHDGIEKAFEIVPDMIICDVNLPVKNGFEICEILKKDLRTSHIPTIILTALGNKESYIKGLESGADLFLTKPFSLAILFQSIKGLLYNRAKLRYYYTNNIETINKNHEFGVMEQDFLAKMNSVIHENIDNSSFSVEQLAEELNISRVQLYRKIKAILDIKVSDYILNIRLEKGKEMLESNYKLSISDIAYSVGFSSSTYFSTSFKGKYGKTPKAFRERL
ncbi:Sensor histidine kinase TodS [Mariniflexile rhizosphaerae]|uniref:hybrid sensor histidine kinase/response regulator transcription factor n=1 Tax=unclassified Mariniflexile TaxID=2643887 RepID=UPI000CBE85A1|nr:substrate-binding domain-containing protein [Mariniflexile sp. TRM1-10]AXP81642.1 Sensor histidine kinase TodS [Mariniflexile sp. TRM1-10]PLB17935.1 MAG: Transcriptional regulator, AraC family [Flavobacteriaceae bacterium FS1-H7996/R]